MSGSGLLNRLFSVFQVAYDVADAGFRAMEPMGDMLEADAERPVMQRQLDAVIAPGATAETLIPGADPSYAQPLLDERDRIAGEIDEPNATVETLQDLAGDIGALGTELDRTRTAVAGVKSRCDALLKRSDLLVSPPGCDGDESGKLDAARETVVTAAARPLSADAEQALKSAVEEHEALVRTVQRSVNERARQALLGRLGTLIPPNAVAATLVPGALDSDAAPLLAERDRIAGTLGAAEPANAVLAQAGKAIDALPKALESLRNVVVARADRRSKLEADVNGLGVPEGATAGQTDQLTKARVRVDQAMLAEVTDNANNTAQAALDEYGRLFRSVRAAVAEAAKKLQVLRSQQIKRLDQALRANVAPKAWLLPADYTDVLKTRAEILTKLNAPGATAVSIHDAANAIDDLRITVGGLDDIAQQREERRVALRDEAGQIKPPGALLPDQKKQIESLKRLMDEELDGDLVDAEDTDATKAVEAYRLAVESAAAELKALGGIDGVSSLCAATGGDMKAFPELEAKLGGRAKLVALAGALPNGGLAALIKAAGSAEAVGKLAPGMTPEEIAALGKELGGMEALGTLAAAHDGAAIKQTAAAIGAPLLEALVARDSAEAAFDLAKHMPDPKPMEDFAAGLAPAGTTKQLAALLGKGCGGSGAKFAKLCTSFDAPALAGLKASGEAAGLMATPDGLADFLAAGCDGNADQLKAFSGGFAATDDLQKLKDLATEGGLGDKPAVLGHLFKTGCAGDPAKLLKVKDAFDGDLPKLEAMLADPGWKTDTKPETLGQVLATGLGGDPVKLKALQGGFSDPGGAAKLGGMISAWEEPDGGGAAKAVKLLMRPGGGLGEDAAKIGSVFQPKLDAAATGKPDRLKAMTKAAPYFTQTAIPSVGKMPKPKLPAGGPKGARMDHFLERHSPTHFTLADIKDLNSMFAPGTTPAEIAQTLGTALAQRDTMETDGTTPRSRKSNKIPPETPIPALGLWVTVKTKKRQPGSQRDPYVPIAANETYVDQFFPLDYDTVKTELYGRGPQYEAWFDQVVSPANGWVPAAKPIVTFSDTEALAIKAAIGR